MSINPHSLVFLQVTFFCFWFSAVSAAEEDSRVKLSGFASASILAGDIDYGLVSGPDVIDESSGFGADNTLGVKIGADINDKVDLSVQMLAKGTVDGYSLNAHWAYIGFELSNQLLLRAGRLNFPGAFYSEVQEVGYSYLWVRNPIEAYTLIPLATYSGVDLVYTLNYREIEFTIQPFLGSAPPFPISDLSVEVGLAYGLSLTSSFDLGKINIVAAAAEDISFVAGGLERTVDYFLISAGVEIEYENIIFIGEITKKDIVNHASTNVVSNSDMAAWYMTLAYRVGDFVPHFTVAGTQSDNTAIFYSANSPAPGAPPAGVPPEAWRVPVDMLIPGNAELFLQRSITAGVRYNLSDQVALKLEAQRITPEKGTWGVFASDPGEHANLFSLAVDLVF